MFSSLWKCFPNQGHVLNSYCKSASVFISATFLATCDFYFYMNLCFT